MSISGPQPQLPRRRFRALEYRPSSLDVTQPAEGPVVVIVCLEADGSISILVDPKWRSVVLESDRETVESLLKTFMERAESDSDLLLKHLSELNFGCLVTALAGEDVSKEPSVLALMKRFAE